MQMVALPLQRRRLAYVMQATHPLTTVLPAFHVKVDFIRLLQEMVPVLLVLRDIQLLEVSQRQVSLQQRATHAG